MALTSILTRLRSALYPMVQQGDVSDALLLGPADVLGSLEGAADVMAEDGRYLEPGFATIEPNLTTVTQVPAIDRLDENGQSVYHASIDWTTKFRPGDEIILGGSVLGNNGRREVATVFAGYLTVTEPWVVAEQNLLYAKPTTTLLRRCRELLIFPGGYETDTELRDLLAEWVTIMQSRGSRSGIVAEMDRVTNSTLTTLIETLPALVQTTTDATYTQSTGEITSGAWVGSVYPGDAITITGSTSDSNGRYTVYATNGTAVLPGHRAANSRKYPVPRFPNVTELQFREDRVNNLLRVRLVNTSDSAHEIDFTITISNGSFTQAAVIAGSGTTSVNATTANLTLSTSTGTLLSPTISEIQLWLSGPSDTTTFQVALSSGTPTALRIGELGLTPMNTDGTQDLGIIWPWRWGGVVRTGLRSRIDESGLTVSLSARPSWHLGLSNPGDVEEDPYTLASPDEFLVIETDHRNPANYSEQDLAVLVRDVLLPADVAGTLRLL